MFRWSAASASLAFLSLKVYAIGKKKNDHNSQVEASELSLYSVPNCESRFVEEPRSPLEETISHLRKAMEPYAAWLQALYSQTKPTVDGALQQGTASCNYLRNSPPEVFGRLSTIGLSGILGYFLGRRSRLKRLVYPCALMGVTASMYYPQDAFWVALLFGEKLCVWVSVALARLQGAWETHVRGYPRREALEEERQAFKLKKK